MKRRDAVQRGAMTHDDLESPMTARAASATRRRPRIDVVPALAVIVGAVLVFGAIWALTVNDPLGGEPVAPGTPSDVDDLDEGSLR